MNTAAAERASHAPNLESLIEGKELNTTDRSGSEPPRSTRDNQHARKPPSKASVKTRASSCVSSLSASVLCRTPKKWEDWATLHKVRYDDEDWENDEFKIFLDSLKYPDWILGEEVMSIIDDLVSHFPKGAEAQHQFSRWRDQLGRDRTEPGDKYRFAALLPILVNAWMSTSFQANPVVNGASNRRGTDTMIELAFQLRRGADHIWRAEVDMVLPGTPDCVRADAVAALNLPEDWTDFLGELNNRYVFSWAWTVELIDLPESTVTFSYEAKVDDFKVVLRQVQLTMFSSQLHRRALGLEDGPVFGATFNKNILRFYVSNWENDTVVVRRILGPFILTNFRRFIECYFVLCAISDFQSLRFANEMKRWDEIRDQQRTKLRNSAAKPWRKGGKENNKGGRHANNSNQDRGDETDAGEMELDEADQDDGEVDVGTSRQQEIKFLEDRLNGGDLPPKDGYPLAEVYRYIFDHNPNFQSRCHVPSVSEWARESSQFVGHYEDTNSDLIEYTMGEDVAASVDAVSSADTSDEMECDESHPNENVAVVDSNEELGNGLVDSMVSPLGHPDEFSAKTGQPRIGLEKSTYNTFTMSGNSYAA